MGAASYDIWRRDMDTDEKSTYDQHHVQEWKDQHLGKEEDTTDEPNVSPLGDHTTRKDDRQGRPAKQWRDDMDKYWSDMIWQSTAQDRLTWRRHAEAFAQLRNISAAQ